MEKYLFMIDNGKDVFLSNEVYNPSFGSRKGLQVFSQG